MEERILGIKDMIEEMLFWPKKNVLFKKISAQNIQLILDTVEKLNLRIRIEKEKKFRSKAQKYFQ